MSTDIEYNNISSENDNTEVVIEGSERKLRSSKSLSFLKKSKSVRTGNANTRISLSDIPPELAEKLKHLDLGNDGYLDIEDILVLDEKEQLEQNTMIQYRRMFIALTIIWILQVAAVFAVSFAAINASKDSYVTNNVLQTKSGAAVQTASVDYCTSSSGSMILRLANGNCPSDQTDKPPAIATASSTVQVELTSSLPYSTLAELKSLYLVSPTGNELFVAVTGFIRQDDNDLTLLTNIGDLHLSGSTLTFTETTAEKYFQLAGFTVLQKGNSRRLEETKLTGTFNNNIPAKTPNKAPTPSAKPTSNNVFKPVTFSVLEKQVKAEIETPIASYDFDLTKKYCSVDESVFRSNAVVTQQQKKKLLCSMFVELSEKSVNNIVSNFQMTSNSCDWVVVGYAGDAELLKKIQLLNNALPHPVVIVDAVMAPSPLKVLSKYCKSIPDEVTYSNGLIYPKPILYFQLLPHVNNYEQVWLIDEDISLNNIDINKMLTTFDKTFSSSGSKNKRPLITQPLLAGDANNNNYFKERLSTTWKGLDDEATFAMVDFVEIMAPIFNSQYFHWLVNEVVVDLLPQLYFFRSDNGLDNIWCKSAMEYTKKVLHKTTTEASNCAIYLSNQSIQHLDWETIANNVDQDKKSLLIQKYKSSLFNNYIKNKFSTWYTDPQSDEIVHEIISNKL